MEKGKGKETSKSDSESNTEDDPKPNDTTIALRSFFQQVLLQDQSSPSQTNEDRNYLNTAQVVEKLAHKEPALLYFYHKIFPDPDYEKVVTGIVTKVIEDAKESAKSPRMKPRSYVPPNVCRPRASDLFDKTSTVTEDEYEELEARKLVLLSNLQGILLEAIMLNELQEESQKRSESARKLEVGRRVDVPYTPVSTSKANNVGMANEQKSQVAPSPALTVKEIVALPPPPPLPVTLESGGSNQKSSQASSNGKGVETANGQHNQVVPTSSFNPVDVKVEKEKDAFSDVVFTFKRDTQKDSGSAQASTSKEKTAKPVDEQDIQAARGNVKENESATVPPPPPPVVGFKPAGKHFTFTQASASKGKSAESTNEQNNRATPVINSNSVNVEVKVTKEKASLSEFVIDFISKTDSQKYFTFSKASTSNGKSTEKVNEQQPSYKSGSNVEVEKEKVAPPPVVPEPESKGDDKKQSTSAQASTSSNSDPINIKVKVAPPPPSTAADLKYKETEQKHSGSTEASTSNGKSSSDHIKVKVEKEAFFPPPDADLNFKESDQKRSTRSSTQASNEKPAIYLKVEKERAAPRPPPPPPASPPPVRCRPKMENIRQPDEIYVTSAHAREKTDKSRLRQAQDAHLRSGGRVVPKPEPVDNNPIQEEAKPKPKEEKGKEREEMKSEPVPPASSQSGSNTRAGSSKPQDTTAKPEPKPTENKSSEDKSNPKVSSATQTEPVKEPKSSESYEPRAETRYQYQYRPASSPPPKARQEDYRDESGASASGYRYGRPLPARGAPYTAQCSGITNENRRCLIMVRTTFDGVSLEPFCQWHGEYYGSTKPKSLDPNKKERGRCSATTLKGTLCKRNADYYSSKSEYGYCWQHERIYGWKSVYS